MLLFDMGKNQRKFMESSDIPQGERLCTAGTRYTKTHPGWLGGYSILSGSFYGDRSHYVRDVEQDVVRLPTIGLSDDDTRKAIVYLERTALELRELIGEG